MKSKVFQTRREDIIIKIVAILLIVALTMVDFAAVGLELVAYAADATVAGTATNNRNVTFDAYFKDANGGIVTNKEESISNEDMKLYVQVAVVNEGYFNGKIDIEESNFKLKNEARSNSINKIEGNTITLNQINSGEVAEIELGIEAIKDDTINSGLLNMTSKIQISGTYRDSKEKDIEIKSKREVKLELGSPYTENEGMEIRSEVITNKVYEIEGEEKRVVQVLVESGLEGNKYPVKENKIEVEVPEGVEEVEVIARGKQASNGKEETEFRKENWTYKEAERKIEITIKNEAENNTIRWEKSGKDRVVVTYMMKEDKNLEGKEIAATSKITMYDTKGTEKAGRAVAKVAGEKDGVITAGIEVEEKSIYKGKIYSGEDREYKERTNIYVNSSKTEKEANIEKLASTYEVAEGEIEANIEYVNTKINKEEVTRVLGQDGTLRILSAEGTELALIDGKTEVAEEGKITISYPAGIKGIKVVTTGVKSEGTISIETTKRIKADQNGREIKRRYTGIKERATGTEETIELKETETKVEVEVNKPTWSTLIKNENIQITATLVTNNEKYDLYKNPTLEVVLPEGITNIEIKSIEKLYSEMFNIVSSSVIEGNNGTRIIRIVLDGEQTAYTAVANQPTILITADVEFEKLSPSREANIVLNYTNLNGLQGNYSEAKAIKVESKYGLIMYTTIEGYNEAGESVSTIDDAVAKGNLDLEGTSRTAVVKDTLINNYDEEMQNVSIIGKIPTVGMNDGTINSALSGEIKTTLQGTQILYSNDVDAKASDNTWTESAEGAKAFKINIGSLPKGEPIVTEYAFNIPENLGYGQRAYAKIEAQYTYLGTDMTQESIVGAETVNLTGISVAALKEAVVRDSGTGLQTSIGTTTAGKELKDGDSIYEGQAIEYTVQMVNNTGKDLENVKISVEQENGVMYGLKEVEVYMGPVRVEGEETKIQHIYSELDKNTTEFNTVERFENGKTISFKYEIVANQVERDSQTKGKITITANDNFEENVETISNKIEQAELKLNYQYRLKEEVQLFAEQQAQTMLNIENISGKELKDIQVTVKLPEGTYLSNDTNIYTDNDNNISNKKYNEDDNTVTFELSTIKSDEIINVVLILDTKEMKDKEKDLAFLAEAKTKEGKNYYSNVMTRNMKNIAKNITITQETNLPDDAILNYGDEFTIAIKVRNDDSEDVIANITDVLPQCFTLKNAILEKANESTQLNIVNIAEDEDIETENQSYVIYNSTINNTELNVNETLGAGQEIKILLNVKVDTDIEENTVTNTAKLIYNKNTEDIYTTYTKNLESEKIFSINNNDNKIIKINQTSNIENKSTIKDGQEIIYEAQIKNTSGINLNVNIEDSLPIGMKIKNVVINGENINGSLEYNDVLSIEDYTLNVGSTTNLKITAEYEQDEATEQELTNVISVGILDETVSSNPITYYAMSELDDEDKEDEEGIESDNGENNGENPVSNPDDRKQQNEEQQENVSYSIKGLAWLDLNKNGQRESNEELLQGIQVKAIDTETGLFAQENGNDVSAVTDNNGSYTLTLKRGNYIVAFMYDSNKYATTQYQKAGVSSIQNSDAISKVVQINGNNYSIAATDNIKLISEDVENIDIGLLENTKFDFELNKYISEITVRTSKGTNTYNYTDAELAKVEIHAKELNNANVIIKYKMRVTNNGEIAGYVKDMVDYMPTALSFSSELNKDWYQSDKNLHNTTLLNTKLEAGETKEVELILTKTMTENNTGLISNLAELADVGNELGANDLDSTPGNKSQGEDDLGKADVIIGVKTGALVMYISLVLTVIVIIGIGAYMINRKILKDNIEDIDF